MPSWDNSSAGEGRPYTALAPNSPDPGRVTTRSEFEILVIESDPVVAAYLEDVISDIGVAWRCSSLPSCLRELLVCDRDGAVVGLDGQGMLPHVALSVLRRRRIPVVLYTASAEHDAWAAQFPGVPVFCNNPPRDEELARRVLAAVDATQSGLLG